MDRRDFIRAAALCASAGALGAAPAAGAPVRLGVDVLADSGFAMLQGRRVGLVTHRAGVNGAGRRTADVLARAPGVRLLKLFGPEHGIDGVAKADVKVKDMRDARTGLPVFSLYGATRKPTPAMLEGLDDVVIDFQDVGVRSYTYVSCMRLVIEACFAMPKPVRVIVLDRPNPIGGEKVDGPFLDRTWRSYVGAYETPYVHGLTIGELARWAVATPEVLDVSEDVRRRGRLEVLPMAGWRRAMPWISTGLNWTPTSPMVPTPQAALGYAMVGLGCQIGGFKHTFGDQMHFRFISHQGRRADEIVRALGATVPGLVVQPRVMGDGTQGAYLAVGDWQKFRPVRISSFMLRQTCAWLSTGFFAKHTRNDRELFIKHFGSEAFYEDLRVRGASVDLARWFARWDAQAESFRTRTAPFRIYA